MKNLEFYIVDVFAEKKYAGNQLAVFRNSKNLSDEEMQSIAKETNFSETTFIHSDMIRDGGYDVRIFTPEAEVPFAGHPTLGTAFIIKEYILQRNVEQINLNLKVGQIHVQLFYNNGSLDYLWMKQINPIFGKSFSADDVAPILNIDKNDIDLIFPIQEVSTGLPYFIVPLNTLKAIQKIKIDKDKYYEFIRRNNAAIKVRDSENVVSSAFFVFCPQIYDKDNDINARMFDDYYGAPEDAATGSANGCLLGYLLKHNYYNKNALELKVEQGYEIKRPSLIKIKGKVISDGEIEVFVGGKVQMIARGEWL